jgi:hypothetical protein
MRTIDRFATGAAERFADYFTAGLMIVGTVVVLSFLFVSANGAVDIYGRPIGTDFRASGPPA